MGRRLASPVWLLALALLAQAAFWWGSRDLRGEQPVVPPPPSERAVAALAFGDRQFLYRALGLEVQNLGDTGGRFTPLARYDYRRLAGWFDRLDALDPRADYAPALAAHYYGQTPKSEDVRHVVAYLRRHAAGDPERKWRWLAHAAYLARHKVKDLDLALAVARELAGLAVPGIPIWTKQMPAFVLAAAGDTEAARDLMAVLLATTKDLSPQERTYLQAYIDGR